MESYLPEERWKLIPPMIGLVLGYFLAKFVVTVPKDRMVVVERDGCIQHIWGPGYHWMNWWTCRLRAFPQLLALRRETWWDLEQYVPTDRLLLVFDKIEAPTSDGVCVTVGARMRYYLEVFGRTKLHGGEPHPSILDQSDPFVLLDRVMIAGIRYAVSRVDAARLNFLATVIAEDAERHINEALQWYGVRCERIVLSKLELDRTYVAHREELAKEQHAAELRKLTDRLEHERRRAAAELERTLTKVASDPVLTDGTPAKPAPVS